MSEQSLGDTARIEAGDCVAWRWVGESLVFRRVVVRFGTLVIGGPVDAGCDGLASQHFGLGGCLHEERSMRVYNYYDDRRD